MDFHSIWLRGSDPESRRGKEKRSNEINITFEGPIRHNTFRSDGYFATVEEVAQRGTVDSFQLLQFHAVRTTKMMGSMVHRFSSRH